MAGHELLRGPTGGTKSRAAARRAAARGTEIPGGALPVAAAGLAGLAALLFVSVLAGPGVDAVATGVAVSYATRGLWVLAPGTHRRTRQWRVARLGVLADVAVAATLLAAVWLQSWMALVPLAATLCLLVIHRAASRRLAELA